MRLNINSKMNLKSENLALKILDSFCSHNLHRGNPGKNSNRKTNKITYSVIVRMITLNKLM